MKLMSTLRYLLRQGLPIRGHIDYESNYEQLLMLRAEDCPDLAAFLKKRRHKFTSHGIQNEMINLQAVDIVHTLVQQVKCNKLFSVMLDGTQDIAGNEQESFCIRHVDDDLNVMETFLGLHLVEDTTGQSLANLVVNTLNNLQLDPNNIRGQVYDGAANMSGSRNGCQAIIKGII